MQGDKVFKEDRMSCLGVSKSKDQIVDVPAGEDVYVLVQRGSVPGDMSIDVTSEYQYYNGAMGTASPTPLYLTINGTDWYQVTDRAEVVVAAYKNSESDKPDTYLLHADSVCVNTREQCTIYIGGNEIKQIGQVEMHKEKYCCGKMDDDDKYALEHLKYFVVEGSWGLLSMRVTSSGKPDTEEIDYNDGVFDENPSVYDTYDGEDCWDTFFAPFMKFDYCTDLQSFLKGALELVLLLVVIAASIILLYGVWKLALYCNKKK